MTWWARRKVRKAVRRIDRQTVVEAMKAVPRHRFVPHELRPHAYADQALPIGHGQTISQPFVVAIMSQALDVAPGARVLEIGTGSGYQAAVLAEMGLEVYSVEIIPELAHAAQRLLDELGYAVNVKTGDGYDGWVEFAPYDAIIVTAAPDHAPQALVDQLVVGGALVIPVGPEGGVQTLWRYTKRASGELESLDLGPVRFVPFTRSQGDG